jgi:3-hydroxybutyryl-CoA dehydratase
MTGPHEVGYAFPPVTFEVTEEMIRQYAEASYDFNPLHLDPAWMENAEFGATRYGGVIAHGLMTYSVVGRMITDVVYSLGGRHERCEMRFTAPVHPGDTITTTGRVTHVRRLGDEALYTATVEARNQSGVVVESGDAMGRVPA